MVTAESSSLERSSGGREVQSDQSRSVSTGFVFFFCPFFPSICSPSSHKLAIRPSRRIQLKRVLPTSRASE
jgi:hypothetical protein